MNWEQVLAEFQRLLGRRVMVSISRVDPDPEARPGPSAMLVSGVPRKGEPSRRKT
jgi:hypothetical protein